MKEFHNTGESIECSKCEILTRKVVPSSLQIHATLGKVMKYEMSKNCSAEIIEEVDPKEWKVLVTSNLNKYDMLKAKGIFALSTSLRPIKWDVINLTGTHKAQKANFRSFTFAQIKYPLENVINSMRSRKELN